ncbi:MAG: ATP-dependent nuclease [Chloroflexota bacterium]
MRIHSIRANNYGPFYILEEVKLGPLATIVGQNDAGKSNILRALQLFFEGRKIEEEDVHNGASSTDNVVLEVTFTSLPDKIELEEGVETTFQEEMLVDKDGNLRIRKIYPRGNLAKYSICLITKDFEDDRFAALPILKEAELNQRCEAIGIEATRSGRGVTNKGKREALKARGLKEGIQLIDRETMLTTKDDLWKTIASLLPEFLLFETDTKLGVGETTFQSQFRPIIKTAAEQPDVVDAKNAFTGAIGRALQGEIDKIHERLQRHTDVFNNLTVKPDFSWDKAVSFDIFGKDQYGVENSLARRGSGIQRLLMVAFFQYLVGRKKDNGGDFIFAVEEPENCLHPGLQRELVLSFRRLAEEGYQVITTSHSPVFAGASPIEDLALVVREAGVAKAIQIPELDLAKVAEQLGVEPSDQITGYNACIFVEGPSDIEYWTTIAQKLKEAGRTDTDFNDRNIGFVMCGGETLKYWIDLRAMGRLNRHFGAVVDSDRESPQHDIPGRKKNWKQKCEAQGGIFFILKKREIENYLHRDAIIRSHRDLVAYDDFSDMKKLFGENVYKVISDMSCAEILDSDRYQEGDVERHELEEITLAFLALAASE